VTVDERNAMKRGGVPERRRKEGWISCIWTSLCGYPSLVMPGFPDAEVIELEWERQAMNKKGKEEDMPTRSFLSVLPSIHVIHESGLVSEEVNECEKRANERSLSFHFQLLFPFTFVYSLDSSLRCNGEAVRQWKEIARKGTGNG